MENRRIEVHLVLIQSTGFIFFIEWAKKHGASYYEKVYDHSFKKAIDEKMDVKQLQVDMAKE